MARTAYHHGDLPRAVMAAALEDLASGDRFAVNISRIAKQLGVSHGAVYRHFASKQALLDALATQGFERLGDAFTASLAEVPDGTAQERLHRLARSYVRFMLDQPMLGRVMFSGAAADRHRDPSLKDASFATIMTLRDEVARLSAEGALAADDVADVTWFFWASMHGLATLRIESQLDGLVPSDAGFEALVDRAAGWLVASVVSGTQPRG